MSVSNGDTNRIWQVGAETVRGIGSFHKSLPHNKFGEVDPVAFAAFVAATRGDGTGFSQVAQGAARTITNPVPRKGGIELAAAFTNPQAGLAADRLTAAPDHYTMPAAPGVTSNTTAAEMLELYWMALMRDVDLCTLKEDTPVQSLTAGAAVVEINTHFSDAVTSAAVRPDGTYEPAGPPNGDGERDRFIPGVDLPGSGDTFKPFTIDTIFRLGLPGDDVGPMVSQFFLRPAHFGTQTIDQRQRPYKAGNAHNYLTSFDDWLMAQNSGRDASGQAYSASNEDLEERYEKGERYIATMRDLARFVNKDALHQAYFNAALILLSGGAKWPIGNPYHNLQNGVVQGTLPGREAGFGVLGGPHILALVSEVATRALKVVWRQKWQEHLRLRPEAYGGLLHVQTEGVDGTKRPYGLPDWLAGTGAVKEIKTINDSLLLPMAFTAGSPTHPAYGAGHATVAGACVTVLKAFFLTFTTDAMGNDTPIAFSTLTERAKPFGAGDPIVAYCGSLTGGKLETCLGVDKFDNREKLDDAVAKGLTIEGELNKLAQNVAMGRSMGGVHWRTDNARSLMLGEALAAEILAGITADANEECSFTFRTFSRTADGKPKKVRIEQGRVYVDGVERSIPTSML